MTGGDGKDRLYVGGEMCPCDVTDCPRHGDCAECTAFHRKTGDKTACEKLVESGETAKKPALQGAVGDDFRLTDYASCAG